MVNLTHACGTCGRQMKKRMIEGAVTWKCLNVSAHDAAGQLRRVSRGTAPTKNAGRKKKT